MIPLAHVRKNEDGSWEKQTLAAHLEAVSRLAADFAGAFASEDWGRIAGRLHDLGKASPAWQKHLKDDSGCEPECVQKLDGDGGSAPQHSVAGAVAAVCDFLGRKEPMDVPAACAWALAYAIAGHHAGLADWDGDGRSALISRFSRSVRGESCRKDWAMSGGRGFPDQFCPFDVALPAAVAKVFSGADDGKLSERERKFPSLGEDAVFVPDRRGFSRHGILHDAGTDAGPRRLRDACGDRKGVCPFHEKAVRICGRYAGEPLPSERSERLSGGRKVVFIKE